MPVAHAPTPPRPCSCPAEARGAAPSARSPAAAARGAGRRSPAAHAWSDFHRLRGRLPLTGPPPSGEGLSPRRPAGVRARTGSAHGYPGGSRTPAALNRTDEARRPLWSSM